VPVAPQAQASPSKMQLPTLVFGVVEVRRLQRELESLEAYMQQENIRQVKTKTAAPLPRVSRLLDALASENNCNLLKQPERALLSQFLQQLVASAPAVHMSFASDPSAAFIAKIVAWLRSNIDPNILLQIGLQPSIAAGCIVRTTNKVFDLSLRQHFDGQKVQFTNALAKKVAV
jgi:F0F1-type ATP synthase delta subunit